MTATGDNSTNNPTVTTAAHDQAASSFTTPPRCSRASSPVCSRSPAAPEERRHKSLVTNLVRAIVVVAFSLLVNLARGKPRGTPNTRATEHHVHDPTGDRSERRDP